VGWRGLGEALAGAYPILTRSHAMAYDAARGKTVLFSGSRGDGEPTVDTWEWDGTDWTHRGSAGPTSRSSFDVAYDSARERVVLRGGLGSGAVLADTWEWDGTSWSQRSDIATPRESHAMAFDHARGKVMLFSGASENDTWEWDGTGWTRRAIIPPSAGLMTYDRARDELVNVIPDHLPAMTWIRSGTRWARATASSAPRGAGGALTYDDARELVVFFGGADSNGANVGQETWEWGGSTWTLRMPATSPGHRSLTALAYDSAAGKVLLFGGWAPGLLDGYLGDTWEWDGAEWTQRAPTGSPSPRAGHAMACDAARGTVVLLGGVDESNETRNDVWEWDGVDWTERDPVVARRYHTMAYDSARSRIVLHGGFDDNHLDANDETWEWDGTEWTLIANGPPPRHGAALAYDASREAMVLFGGALLDKDYSDTWETIVRLGTSCTVTAQCAAGSCVDGVCCDTPATSCDPCFACNAPGSLGTCAPLPCPAPDICHLPGECDPATGACSTPPAADGTACDDGDPETDIDACRDGVCAGVDGDPGDPDAGACSSPAQRDDLTCADAGDVDPKPDGGAEDAGGNDGSVRDGGEDDEQSDAGDVGTERDGGAADAGVDRDGGAGGPPAGCRGGRCSLGASRSTRPASAITAALLSVCVLRVRRRRLRAHRTCDGAIGARSGS